ncbi:MAG: Lrp/AsnC family transcriptional regulator [Thermoplasmatota archaeon]
MNRNIDDLDWEILKLLKTDSRRSNVSIASELGISEGSVRQRISKLKKKGTITRFTIDTSSRGLKALLEINIEINVHTSEIAERIKTLEGVEKVYEISGASDIVAIIDVSNTNELNDTIEAVRGMGHIMNTRTKLVLSEI